LDRLLIIPTHPYGKEEVEKILKIRIDEENVSMEPKALQLLTVMGMKTSLRYALHMITVSNLLAQKRNSAKTEPQDVKRCYELFVDKQRSKDFLDEYQSAFSQEITTDAEGDVVMNDA